jgi:hypothetical protein
MSIGCKQICTMVSADGKEGKRGHARQAFIPAGALIGLGLGLLLNHPGPGVLIGLGFGFLVSSFVRSDDSGQSETVAPSMIQGVNWFMLMLGVFMILIGIGIGLNISLFWPYLPAAFLILLGIMFVVRGIGR